MPKNKATRITVNIGKEDLCRYRTLLGDMAQTQARRATELILDDMARLEEGRRLRIQAIEQRLIDR